MAVPTLTPAFIIPEGIGGGLSGGGGNVGATAAGVVAAGVIAGGLAVVAAPVVAGLAAKASLLTAASPLGLLAVGAFLKGLEQLREWGLANWRPMPQLVDTGWGLNPAGIGTMIPGNAWVRIRWGYVATFPGYNGLQTVSAENVFDAYAAGVSATNMQSRSATGSSPPGVAVTGTFGSVHLLNAQGQIGYTHPNAAFSGAISMPAGLSGTVTVSPYANFTIRDTGEPIPIPAALGSTSTGTFAPGTRPQLFPPTLPDAPVLPPPARDPVPLTPVLPPPPDRRPLAPPVVIPRPGQQPARVPVPGPSPGPSPGPGPAPVPAQPAPLQVPGIGPLPLPAPLPVPVTPVEVVVVDGLPISGPGQAPAPNLVAIAQELGRLERKNEILMRRPENGGLGEAAENSLLNGLRELLEGLVGELLNDVGGGSFQLIRPCQAPGGGDPLPPVVVPYSGGTNATMAVLAKLDGIAGLIQAHKDVGQPTCVTPVFGEEVTVHFESE
jgi:hypothetical protein